MADPQLARLESDVAQLLQQIPTAGSNAAQLELLTRAQEIALNRDPSPDARLLHAARPFLPTLLHQQNAPLVAAVLQLLSEATRRNAIFFADLYEAVATVLLLSFSSEKNVLRALDLATSSLLDAFQCVVTATAALPDALEKLWRHVTTAIDHVADLVVAAPIASQRGDENNNRSAAVFLRAWKLLERAVLMLTDAKNVTVYRDPARSNVQPDAVCVDVVLAAGHAILQHEQLLAHGDTLLRRLLDRVLSPTAVAPLTRRELCVAINSLSLLAAVRPQLMGVVLPALLACHTPDPTTADRAVQATLKANLIKLLSHPAAQELAEEVTECVIALQDGERAFRAISKSKDPRRKYVSAPSEASLRRARIGKRTAEQISESVEQQDHAKAKRVRAGQQPTSAGGSERVTPESLVNMPSATVLHLVLGAFAADLPPPPSANLTLLLPPSELKTRVATLLAKLATPSSVLALDSSIRRSRDPRRRRESRDTPQTQPSLLSVFDDETVDEVSDWVSKNATTVEEPLVSLAEDNSVQVFLKPVLTVWCRDMAAAALARILENEYGASIRGDDALRENLLCRLASSPWFLLTNDRNETIHPTVKDGGTLPPVYQTILDFVLDDVERRASLATALLHHEYVRVTTEMVSTVEGEDVDGEKPGPPRTGDVIYRKAVDYFLTALVGVIDLSSSSHKKLFGSVVAALPRVTVEVFRVVMTLFNDPQRSAGGAVLGITVLRDLVRDRKSCEQPALQVLLLLSCESDETCRVKATQCVANQLYLMDALKAPIEQYAVRLVTSLEEKETSSPKGDVAMDDEEEKDKETDAVSDSEPKAVDGDSDVAMETPLPPTSTESTDSVDSVDHIGVPIALRSAWLRARLAAIHTQDTAHTTELQQFASALDQSSTHLDRALDNDIEVLRRLELLLGLCAKKPALLRHVVQTYGRASELVRQVVFHAIEKLIKHLKRRSSGTAAVVAQLHGFAASALGLVCHVVQVLAARSSTSSSSVSNRNGDDPNAELVAQVLALWRAHTNVADAISVVIPLVSSIPKEQFAPLLPPLLALPSNRWSVAMTRVFEALPPHQVLTPIDLLLALHHVDLKQDAGMQKKVILGINFCLEHRHAFPAEVLLHVCRVLLTEETIPKLALRTLILSVTAFPSLQQDAAQLLRGLVDRRVWDLTAADDNDALWKGFVKCAALVQPASFPVLLETARFPIERLASVLQDEPALRGLLRAYVASPEGAAADRVHVSDDVRALLLEGVEEDDGSSEIKQEGDGGESKHEEMDIKMEDNARTEGEGENKTVVKMEQ